jgi:hypothetical protein
LADLELIRAKPAQEENAREATRIGARS